MTPDGRSLLKLYRSLSAPRQAALREYAEFLASREADDQAVSLPAAPLPIERPAVESVVKAIKRLMATYPMLERNKLFHETSAQMTRHVVHGVPASEVIDDLEALFRKHYLAHIGASESPA
jgi:hypothetical protein